MPDDLAARAVAFFLPQFHPIPENDAWWGPGFTEWTNAAKARPLFPGHRQPTLPADLGFYDLRLPETREAQSALADKYGVEAFCYWHYWFGGGRRVLETPFTEVLASGEPSVSFCLGWANQTWTGIWHGAADRVLMEQTYPGPEDDQAHFDAIVAAFRDERYLRVDGRPVFYVFRPEEAPDAAEFVDRWQRMARQAGLDGLYLAAESSDLLGRGPKYTRGLEDGFDSSVHIRLPVRTEPRDVAAMRARRKLLRGLEVYPYAREPLPLPAGLDPDHYVQAVYPNWDNTPRSGRRGLAVHGSSPEKFRPHVRAAIATLAARPGDERLLWIKSWNEWAEGNHLEPDLEFGHGWLQVLHEEDPAVAGEAPLRIAMISYYLPSESKIGVGYQVHALATAMAERGHEVTVLSACAPVPGAPYGHRLVRPRGSLRTFRFATQLRRADLSGYDVLHAHGDDYWMWRRRVAAHVRTLHGSCFEEALHIRGVVERTRMVLLGFSEVLASLVADRSVLVSPATRRWTPWVSTVIPNGVSLQTAPADTPRADHPVVLFVGTWQGRKRGRVLADAFVEHVVPVLPDAELWMVSRDVPGDVHPSVKALGRVSDSELADLYARAWAFCLPSSYEGFGIPYAEAMASRLPVVATPNPGSRFVTDEGRAGILVDDDRLGPELLALLRDDERRGDLATRGWERSRDFTLDRVVTAYEDLYRDVLSERGAGHEGLGMNDQASAGVTVNHANIVFLTHSGADSGAEQSMVTYLSRWPRIEPRPLLLLGASGAIEPRAEAAGLDFRTLPVDPKAGATNRQEMRISRLAASLVGLLRHSTKVRRVLSERSADVVVPISLKSLVFGWLAGRRAGATVVWSLHDRVDCRYFSWFLVPALRYLAPRLVDGILVNSRSTLATIRPGRTPVIVATPAIALDPRDFHESGDEVRRVVMLARLSPWKGQDVFLRAFAKAFEGSPAEAFVVGGALFGETEYEQSLKTLAGELGIADRVHFVGHVQDPWACLVDADVLVHASTIPEPFGQVVVQGLWARCAVVASTPGGPAEVITDGVDGLLTPCGDVDALAAALGRLRYDHGLRLSLARHGHVTGGLYDAAVAAPVLDAWLANLHMGAVEQGSVRGVFPQRS